MANIVVLGVRVAPPQPVTIPRPLGRRSLPWDFDPHPPLPLAARGCILAVRLASVGSAWPRFSRIAPPTPTLIVAA